MQHTQSLSAHAEAMTHDAVCAVAYSATSVQPGHPDACCMTVHFSVRIYLPLGDRWECARGEKCETQLDSRYTLDDVHALPLTLGQRSSHTTHRPLAPRLSAPPSPLPLSLPPSTPVCSSFPLFSHAVSSASLQHSIET